VTPDERFLDEWVLSVLRRRHSTNTDYCDFFTMAAIDDKWGAETPILLRDSNACRAYLSACLERLLEKKLIHRLKTYFKLTNPLESFVRQVHERP
jgi:hypothetical protein